MPVVSKGIRSSASLRLEEEMKVSEKQGIGSILFSSPEKKRSDARPSLRRTFSADMSSKKWLAQTIKRVPSSEEFSAMSNQNSSNSSSSSSSLSEEEEEEEEEQRKKDLQRPAQFDIWRTIQEQKEEDSKLPHSTLPPYVHPLVKRSSSSLSQKSLEICTESLGSETGSDGFSFDLEALSSSEGEEEEEERVNKTEKEVRAEIDGVKYYNCSQIRTWQPRSFPPPLPSISRSDGAPRIHMRPHRKDGRLVLEAVPIAAHNYLHAEREGGRLRLTLINPQAKGEVPQEEEAREEEEEKEEQLQLSSIAVVRPKEEGFQDSAIVRESRLVFQFHRAAVVMNRFLHGMPNYRNQNPWEKEKKMEGDSMESMRGRTPPRLLSSKSLNSYECSWKGSNRVVSTNNTYSTDPSNKLLSSKKQLLIRNSTLPLPVKSRCVDPRRTVVIWEPFCIATN